MTFTLDCGRKVLDLSQPHVMGILNVTPDSFSDGDPHLTPKVALQRARQMATEGAVIIDVGGESTRPGAIPVPAEEELRRVIPVIEALAAELPVVISVDTSKERVMRAAVAAGADMINDIWALTQPGALDAAVELGVPICLVHMQGEPRTMQLNPQYRDVLEEVKIFLRNRVLVSNQAGISVGHLLIDPGFGFGKTLKHNLVLMKYLHELKDFNLPIVVGVSRKSMVSAVLNTPVDSRLYGSIALATLAAVQGASLIRAHDVGATVQAIKMAAAVETAI